MVHKVIGIPITFDYLHNKCNPSHLDEEQALALCLSTWTEGVPAITHYSDSRRNHEDPLCKVVAHSDWLYEKIETYGMDFDIELEVKMKERALLEYDQKIEKILL
jgi:UV DNA damage endonuclease